MIRKIIYTIMIFSFFSSVSANYHKLAYDFNFKGLDGNQINLKDYNDKIIIVVNVASRCGYTPQYSGLQKLWSEYKNDLVVIGVPTNNFRQEPKNNADIKKFCETNFGVTFPMSEKVDVIGANAHPFFKWAKKNHGIAAIPKWNFHKIIIGKNGKVVDTFASFTKPNSSKFLSLIKKEIKS
tara:strand:- start:124 stop:666 length:543 start_codon:yes stop_codon:yes gene_type:complete